MTVVIVVVVVVVIILSFWLVLRTRLGLGLEPCRIRTHTRSLCREVEESQLSQPLVAQSLPGPLQGSHLVCPVLGGVFFSFFFGGVEMDNVVYVPGSNATTTAATDASSLCMRLLCYLISFVFVILVVALTVQWD